MGDDPGPSMVGSNHLARGMRVMSKCRRSTGLLVAGCALAAGDGLAGAEHVCRAYVSRSWCGQRTLTIPPAWSFEAPGETLREATEAQELARPGASGAPGRRCWDRPRKVAPTEGCGLDESTTEHAASTRASRRDGVHGDRA